MLMEEVPPPESRVAAETGALVNLNKAPDKYAGR